MTIKDYQILNREAWQGFAKDYKEPAEKAWESCDPHWGIWSIPESKLNLLPNDLKGKKCIEIGCGAGYVSSWMARRGGEVVGIDPTPNQLDTARQLEKEHQLQIEFIEGFGEKLPFPDSCFDFAISEYGASLWADPYEWISEAARVLKPGSQLVFMTNHAFAICCEPDGDENEPISEQLQRPYLGLYKTKWEFSSNETEFHLPHGEWIKLLLDNGFIIERLLELGASPESTSRYPWADVEWASKWPTEEVWCVRLSG
ncbi:MAG TPA: class I SAM-dependent methyltransferase [SAR86 cluster bacterium]|nr:class I SAM-dependent methyltransferase [SAR86 cluster bacterium]|tara:strand:+ start:69 stop:839 length:771 start_codon:yes stop_codon:yes gene_type:complete